MGMKFEINENRDGNGNDLMGIEGNGSINCIPALLCFAAKHR